MDKKFSMLTRSLPTTDLPSFDKVLSLRLHLSSKALPSPGSLYTHTPLKLLSNHFCIPHLAHRVIILGLRICSPYWMWWVQWLILIHCCSPNIHWYTFWHILNTQMLSKIKKCHNIKQKKTSQSLIVTPKIKIPKHSFKQYFIFITWRMPPLTCIR